jgi:hypothetical protein
MEADDVDGTADVPFEDEKTMEHLSISRRPPDQRDTHVSEWPHARERWRQARTSQLASISVSCDSARACVRCALCARAQEAPRRMCCTHRLVCVLCGTRAGTTYRRASATRASARASPSAFAAAKLLACAQRGSECPKLTLFMPCSPPPPPLAQLRGRVAARPSRGTRSHSRAGQERALQQPSRAPACFLQPARENASQRNSSLQRLCSRRACAAALRPAVRQIIANEQGNRTTPSYVAFTDTDRCAPS